MYANRVVPDNISNSYFMQARNAPMYPLPFIQLESVPFQSSVSAHLTSKNNKKATKGKKEKATKGKKEKDRKALKGEEGKGRENYKNTLDLGKDKDKDFDQEFASLGLGKIVQPLIRVANNKIFTQEQHSAELKVLQYLKNSGLDNVIVKNLTFDNVGDYFLDSTRKLLYLLPSKTIAKWLLSKYSNYNINVVSKKEFKCFVAKPKMVSQGLFDALSEMFSGIQNTGQFLISVIKNFNNPQLLAWVMDVLTLTLELSDPFFWRPISLLKFLARLWSMLMRFTDFKNKSRKTLFTQSLEEVNSVDSIMLCLACFGLPDPIMRSLKQISLMTNKKILDSPNIIMDLIQKFLEVCFDILVWTKESFQLEVVTYIIDLISQPLNFVKGLKLTSKLSSLTIQFQKNNQIIFDPVIRTQCTELYNELKGNNYVQSLLVNPLYKIYAQHYATLQVMNKLASNFDISARNEPVCIVFEGRAGSGKSTLMNKVIDYLVKKQYSIYNHTCPSVDAAKDFYDDYLDQDVFVMDDVGQQGVSQWRQIINFVSPVKFPLDCAEAKAKNTKFFNSKLLLITTNHFSDLHGFTKSDCIAEPSALFRRCHVLNFDEILFSGGKMTGRIQYKKYDHLKNTWCTSFIGLQADCKLDPTCGLENFNKTVAWVYSLIKIFLDKQSEIFHGNALTQEDETEIDNLVNELNEEHEAVEFFDAQPCAQSGFSFLSEVTKENLAIFREYLSYLENQFVEKATTAYEFLRTDPLVHSSVAAITAGFLKGVFHAMAAIAGHKLYALIVGDTSPENLSENTFREQSVQVWQTAHGDYVKRTFPSMIIDNGNDTLKDISQQTNELSTRISSLRSKMRIIELISKTGYKNTAQGIVSGRRIVVQCHSYSSLEGVANIFRDWHCYSNSSYECNNIPYKVIKEWTEYDMAIIEITLTVPIYKDATHSLFTKDIDEDNPFNARRMFFINSQAALSLDNNFTVNMDSFQVQTPSLNRTYTVQPGTGIEYSITAPGLCGSLLVDAEFGLCGVHVAGTSSSGFAFVLPKRVLRELRNLLTFKESRHFEVKEHEDENYSGLKLFNDVFPSKRPLQKTTLNKSELHDVLTEEARRVGEKVPPNFLSFGSKTLPEIAKKSLKPIPYIPDNAIEFAKKCIRQFFIPFDDLTDKEVIKGLKEEGLSALNKQSVNGYGYDKDKSLYMDFESGEITPLFSKKIKTFKHNCNTDQVQVEDLLFYEAFKDELRLTEKKDKPRSFRVAPLHHTFLVKKYTGKLFAHVKKNMWTNQIAIGMNPYKDWNKLYQKLKAAFINFDGDFGNWDGGAPAQAQDAISELVMEFYKGADPKVLKVLLDSMVRTFVLIKEKLVLTTHSMPSGCWVTAFFNSLINRFLTALVLFLEMEKAGIEATVEDFNRLTDFVLGDDKINGAPQDLAKYFNAITMRNFSESIGMKYTDGDKKEITEMSKPLADCVFLKRGFRWHNQLETVVGPLSLNTLVNSVRYKDSSRDYDEIMGGKMTAFQFEIFLHEDERLKDIVLSASDNASYFYQQFDDEHIKKTMRQDDTYLQVMKCLGKNTSNFL